MYIVFSFIIAYQAYSKDITSWPVLAGHLGRRRLILRKDIDKFPLLVELFLEYKILIKLGILHVGSELLCSTGVKTYR